MIGYYEPKIDLTLLGCGFLGSYHVGAILLLKQIWPQKPYNRICGASCGGLLGALLIAGVKLTDVLATFFGVLREIRASLTYPIKLASINRLVEQCLEKELPLEAHKLCSNRLGISLTKFYSFENKFVSQFNSRRDLIDAVVAGCYIPIWSGLVSFPKFMGQRYLDGAYSNNTPKFPLSEQDVHSNVIQVLVTPFASQVDVSPPDRWGPVFKVMGTCYYLNWNNFTRSLHAMLPHSLELYKLQLLAGHRDMKNYVLNANMVKCSRCFFGATRSEPNTDMHLNLMNKTSFTSSSSQPSSCLLCLRLLEKVDSLRVTQDMIDLMY